MRSLTTRALDRHRWLWSSSTVACGGHHDNATLDHIDGFDNVTTTGNFFVRANPTLVDILGPIQLATIHGSLELSDNRMLTNISGLANVKTIDNDMRVLRNTVLPNLGGMTPTLIGNALNVSANPAMSRCLVGAFATCRRQRCARPSGYERELLQQRLHHVQRQYLLRRPGRTTGQSTPISAASSLTAQPQLAVFDNVTSISGSLNISGLVAIELVGPRELAKRRWRHDDQQQTPH